MNKVKAAVLLAVIVLLTGFLAFVGICGLPVGRYDILPWMESIRQGLDLQGGVYVVYQTSSEGVEEFETKMLSTLDVLRNRLDGAGYTEATIARQQDNRIRIEIPAVSDTQAVLDIIGTPAVLEFRDSNGLLVVSGEQVLSATAVYDSSHGPVVRLVFNDDGTAAFAAATANSIGKQISIVLDGETISSPQVQQAITTGEAIITGQATLEQAQQLATLIESGALPLEMEQLQSSTISATLGVDALRNAMIGAGIGLVLLFIFMIAYYRVLGLVADISLCVYTVLVMYTLSLLGNVQLSLPGIAGIVLGVGMAVDANVIIYERVKEELRTGRTVRSAWAYSFQKAIAAIADANVTTIIAAIVLLYYGTGTIKGYAITLIVSVIISLIMAILMTRLLVSIFIALGFEKPSQYGVSVKEEA